MKEVIFYWESTYMGSYGKGHIIVSASNVDEAREMVRKEFDEHYQIAYAPHSTIEEQREILEMDISVIPNQTDSAQIYGSVVFIYGSD